MKKFWKNTQFVFDNMIITKHEIIASIAIAATMLLIGIMLDVKISEDYVDKNEKYNKAIKIESSDLFQYGMDTNIGNAFVYGKLQSVDTVTYPELDGNYMYVKKVKERYTMHHRTVRYTTGSGKYRHTHTRVETYWTWDAIKREHIQCKQISFCDIVFPKKKIKLPTADYIKTIKESSRIRYKYYVVQTEYTGTIFSTLQNGTIKDNTTFYNKMNTEETLKHLEVNRSKIVFWVLWIILIIASVFCFCYMDNNWIND